MDLDHTCEDPSPVLSCTNVYPAQSAPDNRISTGWATHENGRICHDTWQLTAEEVERAFRSAEEADRVELSNLVEEWISSMEEDRA